MQEHLWLGAPSVVLDNHNAFLEWLSTLPWHLYLALFVIAVVALAVGLGARADRNARRQIERDHQRQAAERAQALRREVYLPAAEAIARAQELIAKLPGLDLSREAAQAVIDQVAGALGRVHLVGSEETLRATTAVSAEFSAAYLALAAKRRPITELQNEIDGLDVKVRHLSYERDQLMASITRMAGDGMEQHAALWSDMNLRFDKLHREIANLLNRRGDKVGALSAAQHAYALEAAQHALKLSKLAVPAYLALRAELGMAIDETGYRLLSQRAISEIERQYQQLAGPVQAPPRPAADPAKQPAAAADGAAEPRPAGTEQPHETRLRMVLKKN